MWLCPFMCAISLAFRLMAVIMSILRFHALSWSELICLRFPISYQSIDICKNCLMSHRAEDDVGIRAESYSICQRTLNKVLPVVAVVISLLPDKHITLVWFAQVLCKVFFQCCNIKRLNPLLRLGYRAKKNLNFFLGGDFVLKKWTKSLVDVSDCKWDS